MFCPLISVKAACSSSYLGQSLAFSLNMSSHTPGLSLQQILDSTLRLEYHVLTSSCLFPDL